MPNRSLIDEPILYQPSFEVIDPDEAEAIAELKEVFLGMARKVHESEGRAMRAVHAKGQGLMRGQLVVPDDLPMELAQGIFAAPGTYEVLVRFSSPPAEQLPDTVSTPRAVALKVLGVPGRRLDEMSGEATQDFLMVNGTTFPRSGPQAFVKDAKLLAMTTERLPTGKKVLSAVLRATEAVLEAAGTESAKIKNVGGQPQVHPLGETYFTQVAFLHGPYMAKYSVAPASPAVRALAGEHLTTRGDDAQREAIHAFFTVPDQPAAEWDLRVQLCTNIGDMPIEDVSIEWSQESSPYLPVARLILPPQQTWSGEASERSEDRMSFDPWHAIEAHRPLGAINRARKAVIEASRDYRARASGCPIHDPPGE